MSIINRHTLHPPNVWQEVYICEGCGNLSEYNLYCCRSCGSEKWKKKIARYVITKSVNFWGRLLGKRNEGKIEFK